MIDSLFFKDMVKVFLLSKLSIMSNSAMTRYFVLHIYFLGSVEKQPHEHKIIICISVWPPSNCS